MENTNNTLTRTYSVEPNGTDGDEPDARGSQDQSISDLFARMTVERNAEYYNMNHKNRGIAIIFNQEHFDVHNLDSRPGTNVDSANLARVLKGLQFNVTVVKDRDANDVNKYLHDISQMDHTNNDCLLVAVLSHGNSGVLYARDTHYKTDKIFERFTADRCPTLAGKPKIFIIQACQGDKFDGGVTLIKTATDGLSSNSYRIPNHADFLVAYSTVPGFYSWRNVTQGSWFIQALCKELGDSGADRDILTLLTCVARRVAVDFESNAPCRPEEHHRKQVPCISTMLIRLLVFGRKQLRNQK